MHFRFGKWFDHEGNEMTVGEAPTETPAEAPAPGGSEDGGNAPEGETGAKMADPRERPVAGDLGVPDPREGQAAQ